MPSIIVPTYKEANNIPELFQRLDDVLQSEESEIIVVDDDSPDRTYRVAEGESDNVDCSVKVIRRTEERGLSSAVMRGVVESNCDIVCVMDADLQHPPEKVPQLVAEIENGHDVAIGSRYVEGGDTEFTFFRRMVSKGATYLARTFLPLDGARDPVSGFFATKREMFDHPKIRRGRGFKILLEVLSLNNCDVAEVPISFNERHKGKSSLGGNTIYRYIKRLLSLLVRTGEIKRWASFFLVGIFGIIIDQTVIWTFTEVFGLYYLLSSIISGRAAITSNFFLNDYFTFGDMSSSGAKDKLYKLFHYHWTRAAGIPLRIFTLWVFTEIFGIWYLLSNLLSIGVGFIWGFLSAKNIVWR